MRPGVGRPATQPWLASKYIDKGRGLLCSWGRGSFGVFGVRIKFGSPIELPFLDDYVLGDIYTHNFQFILLSDPFNKLISQMGTPGLPDVKCHVDRKWLG